MVFLKQKSIRDQLLNAGDVLESYTSKQNSLYDLLTLLRLELQFKKIRYHILNILIHSNFTCTFFNVKTVKTKEKRHHFKGGKKRYIPRVKLKIQKSGLGGKRKINNLALSITKACQPASLRRNKKVYKDPESFYRTSRVLKR